MLLTRSLLISAAALAACPSTAFADLHFADASFNATSVPVSAMIPNPADSSPSLSAGSAATWLAWSRISFDTNAHQSAVVVLRIDPATGPHAGPPNLMLPANDLADVALAYDGSTFLAAYSRITSITGTTTTATDLYLWPTASATDPTTNLLMVHAPGRGLSLSLAPLVRNDGIPFVLGYFAGASGQAVSSGVFTSNATYTLGTPVTAPMDLADFDGRSARVDLDSVFALDSDAHGVVVRDAAGVWATIPPGAHLTSDLLVRAADLVVASPSGANSIRLTAIDRVAPHATSAAWPGDLTPTGALDEIALAPNRRTGEWLVALSHDIVLGAVVDVWTAHGSEHVSVSDSRFVGCQRLTVAPFEAEPDTLAIAALCLTNRMTAGEITVWLVHRDAPQMPDASPDVAADVTPDATVDTDGSDVSMEPALDVSLQGTGPAFRGSGCACSSLPLTRSFDSRAKLALLIALALVSARRRRVTA